MRIINKSIDNGVIKVNDLTFLQFSNAFRGYLVCSKNWCYSAKVHSFWKGYSVSEVKTKFELRQRGNDY